MAKKSKPTREFSTRAMRIYKIAQRGVASRSNQNSVLRAIDRELDTVRVGNPDPEMKEEIIVLKGQVTDADKIIKEHIGVVEKLETDYKATLEKVTAEYGKLVEELQGVSNENDERGLKIIELEEKVTELGQLLKDSADDHEPESVGDDPTGSDPASPPADGPPAGGPPAGDPPAGDQVDGPPEGPKKKIAAAKK